MRLLWLESCCEEAVPPVVDVFQPFFEEKMLDLPWEDEYDDVKEVVDDACVV